MNRLILIVSVVFLCGYSLNAQNQSNAYQVLVRKIDSLKTAVMNNGTVQVPESHWNFIDLSVEERNRVLDYVETFFDQTEYMGFYNLGISLLVRFFHNLNSNQSDDKYTMDRIARLHLENAFYVFRESFSFLGRVADYSEETRERLRNILEGNKTEKDIRARRLLATRDIRRDFSPDIERTVNRIVREREIDDEETKVFLTDSITTVFIEDRIQFMNSYFPFGRHGILRIGSSGDLRFVQGLERILETDFPPPSPRTSTFGWELRINNIREAAIYALAKLGVQKYLDKVYARENFNFAYLGTQEAFLIHLERNFVWNRRCRPLIGTRAVSPCAVVVLANAVEFSDRLLNVPNEIRLMALNALLNFVAPDDITNYDPNQDEKNRKYIEMVYYVFNWIMENQDVWGIREIDYF